MESCFKTFGCGSAIASSSVATEWCADSELYPTASLHTPFVNRGASACNALSRPFIHASPRFWVTMTC